MQTFLKRDICKHRTQFKIKMNQVCGVGHLLRDSEGEPDRDAADARELKLFCPAEVLYLLLCLYWEFMLCLYSYCICICKLELFCPAKVICVCCSNYSVVVLQRCIYISFAMIYIICNDIFIMFALYLHCCTGSARRKCGSASRTPGTTSSSPTSSGWPSSPSPSLPYSISSSFGLSRWS